MNSLNNKKFDLPKILANYFINNAKLASILSIFAIFLGLSSLFLIAKEEEPQIIVPMIDIIINADGLSAKEIEREITEIVEKSMWGISGVEYIYSQSQKHQSLVTVRFKVNHSLEQSLLQVHHKLMTIEKMLPTNISKPQVRSLSIDDVAFLLLSFSSTELSGLELRQIIAKLGKNLAQTKDINNIEILGGQQKIIKIILQPQAIKRLGIDLDSIENAIFKNQKIQYAGKNLGNKIIYDIDVGGRFNNIDDIKNVAIGFYAGKVLRLNDVAEIIESVADDDKISSIYFSKNNIENAISLSFSKRSGVNAVNLSQEIIEKTNQYLQNYPKINLSIMRDYGKSAKAKSDELIFHLIIATLLVALLIAVFMGLRCALVIGIAIPITLSLTLITFYFLDFTLNRVTLFALIFAIGILVDDAIVVVENIERHFNSKNKLSLPNLAIIAVSEIGSSTILATFAVIIAILPMSFVQGLMGPYMKPIPIGASFAMLFSLLVAFMITPIASIKLIKPHILMKSSKNKASFLDNFYQKIIHIFLDKKSSAIYFVLMILVFLILSLSLVYFKEVKVKMLPFDNKDEFQITLDFPASTNLQDNHNLSIKLAEILSEDPNILKIQVFSGEPAPFSFSGMVKHNYLRHQDYLSDLQILLKDKKLREISSHEIIKNLRPKIAEFAKKHQIIAKVLEIPPGPPVLSTVVAEIYNSNAQTSQGNIATNDIYKIFLNEPSLVDLDRFDKALRPKKIFEFDYEKAGNLGVNSGSIANIGKLYFSNNKIGSLQNLNAPEEVGIYLQFPNQNKADINSIMDYNVKTINGGSVKFGDLIKSIHDEENIALYRKNLRSVNYITAEISGNEEAPIYAINKLNKNLQNYQKYFMEIPNQLSLVAIKWDGEIFITIEVFRDLGFAFIFAIIGIYILILIKFKSFSVPIIIMMPIPVSLIGVMIGHYILNSYFTATSMIGFMAGAGIIVRNSIILIDFIEQQILQKIALKEAVIQAGVLRFRPMLLTALAVIFGSLVMLSDPIFNGFAISLIFGEIVATLLSRFLIPILYFYLIGKKREQKILINL